MNKIEQFLSRYYRQSVQFGPEEVVDRITPQRCYRPVQQVRMRYRRQVVSYRHPLRLLPTYTDEAWVVVCEARLQGQTERLVYTYCAEGALDVVLNVAYLKTVEAALQGLVKARNARQGLRG